MAFATSNVSRDNNGTANVLRGTWTGAVGDASGTVQGNGYALTAFFQSNNSTFPGDSIPARISNSNGTWTVTVPYQGTVTNGVFEITFK